MKFRDLRKAVLLKFEQEKSPAQITKDLNNVVSDRNVHNWKVMYLKTINIDLKTSSDRSKTVRTKGIIQRVKKRFASQARQSGREITRQLDISQSSLARITIDKILVFVHIRVMCAYWVRRTLMKAHIRKILFNDEKYFGLDGIYNRQNDRIYTASRAEADKAGAIHRKTQYPEQIMA